MRFRILIVVVLITVGLCAWFFLRDSEAKPDSRSTPPPLPKEVQLKLDALTPQNAPSAQENVPTAAELPPLPPPPESGEKVPAVVWGTVTSVDGQALARARIRLLVGSDLETGVSPEASYETFSDREGKYRLPRIETFGEVRLGAFLDGYAGGWGGCRDNRHGCFPFLRSVAPGEEHPEKNFVLLPALAALDGRVVDQDNSPIEGALVILEDQEREEAWRVDGENAAITDAGGAFSLALPNDEYSTLQVFKKGFASGLFRWVKPNSRNLVLKLEGGGAIVGHVTNPKGQPVPRLPVNVQAFPDGRRPRNVWEGPPPIETTTDDKGFYRVEDLLAQYPYRVAASHPLPEEIPRMSSGRTLESFLLSQEHNSRDWQHTRLGAVSGEFLATVHDVWVEAGRETVVDLVVDDRGTSAAVIHGRVADPHTGEPVSPVWVYALCEDLRSPMRPLVALTVTKPTGEYRIEISNVPTPVDVSITAGYSRRVGSLRDEVTSRPVVETVRIASGQSKKVDIAMRNSVTVDLRVVTEEGEPVPGLSPANVGDHITETDENGELTLFALEPGVPYQFHFEMSDETCFYRGVSDPVRGEPGARIAAPDVVLVRFATGSAEGRILLPEGLDEVPVSTLGCRVYTEGNPVQYLRIPVTPDGALRIEGVPAGLCTLLIYVSTIEPEHEWWALIENVEIVAQETLSLGDIIPMPPVP